MEILNLKTDGKRFNITGRGTVVGISMKENGIEVKNNSLKHLLGVHVTLDDSPLLWEIRGVETMGILTYPMHVKDQIGILYKPVYDRMPCSCSCHRNPGIMHMVACCNDGWIETQKVYEKETKADISNDNNRAD